MRINDQDIINLLLHDVSSVCKNISLKPIENQCDDDTIKETLLDLKELSDKVNTAYIIIEKVYLKRREIKCQNES